MRLKHLEIFNAVMLTGSVSAAARLLHVTQPAATRMLQLAELQTGYPLFTRQRNRLVPTSQAQALYPEVQKLMVQLESVRRLAGALKDGGDGAPLRILVVPSLAVSLLPTALAHFRRSHARLELSIRTLHSDAVAQAIALREADVGFVYGAPQLPALDVEAVATGRMVCVSPVRARGSDRRSTVELADVVRAGCIRIDERDPIGALLAEQCARLGVAPQGGITVQTHHIAMVLAEQGFGAAVIDSFTAQSSSGERLHTRTVLPEIPVSVYALRPQGERPEQAAGDLVAAFRAAAQAAA